jgi:hypothetical protein
MRFSFHPDAEAEFEQAVAYYESKQNGLGLEFADEILVGVARVLEYPKAGQRHSKNTWRCLANASLMGLFIRSMRTWCG